jgi:hypothetical protein
MKQHKSGPGWRRQLIRQFLFALVVVGVSTLLLAAFLLATHTFTSSARAENGVVTGNLGSSPSSGPAGATITVSGSNWSEPDGTTVDFGYFVGSVCSVVTDSQPGTFSSGSFQGWFRWPQGTSLGTFSVCTIIGSSTVTAGSYTILSSSTPSVAISPGTLSEREHVTVTAQNYYPTGTNVTFYWATTSNQIEFELSAAASDANGTATIGLSVPITSLSSGNYLVEALAGGGTPPALFASSGFTYSAPVVPPSPTPKPSPSPALSPTPTQNPSPTATPAASVTPTTGATGTPGVTPTQSGTGTGTLTPVAGTTPTSATTTSTSGGTNSTSPGKSNHDLLIAGILGGLAVLITALAVAFMLRRRGKNKLAQISASTPQNAGFPGMTGGPTAAFPMPGMMSPPGSNTPLPGMPGAGYGQVPPLPVSPMQPAVPAVPAVPAPVPVLVGSGHAGAQSAQGMQEASPAQAPLPYRSLLRPLTPPPVNDPTALQGNATPGTSPVYTPLPQNPELDALRRQIQTGMFVQPIPGPGQRTALQD